MKKRFTDEQIVRILREPEATGQQIREVCRKHNITEQTFFRWRKLYGDMGVAEIRRLQELEVENAKLKRIVADQVLDMSAMKELLGKHW